MNKYSFLLAIAVVSSVLLFSCNRCTQCKYTYKSNGSDTTKTFVEQCGSKAEIDLYESNSKAEAATNNASEVTCEKVK
jgi:hypothetical protein